MLSIQIQKGPLGCPKMTQVLKCCAPEAFSGAKLQVLMENSNKK